MVARTLEARRKSARIKIVEQSRARAIDIAERLRRTVVLHGSALNQEILREADVQDADTLVALTNDDKVNILSCVMAKKLGTTRNLSLLNETTYSAFAGALGIDAHVNPRAVTIFQNPQACQARAHPWRPFHAGRKGRGH